MGKKKNKKKKDGFQRYLAIRSDNPKKKFKSFKDYAKAARSSTKPDARNSYTEQKIINKWLLSEEPKKKDKDKNKKRKKPANKNRGNPFDRNRSSRSGGGKGGAGKGGGGPIKGPSNKEGLSFFEGTQGMTPAEFELYKETKLRGIDSENANKLQNIINSGKIEVAAIQRDASIYGSLVSGFW